MNKTVNDSINDSVNDSVNGPTYVLDISALLTLMDDKAGAERVEATSVRSKSPCLSRSYWKLLPYS